jgi:hypothetical protein
MLAGVDAEVLDLRFAGSICWICCGCLDVVTEPVAWRPFLTLLSVGVPLMAEDATEDDVDDLRTSSTRAPAGASPAASACPGHPEHPPEGPTLTADDVLDLHILLAGESWFTEAFAGDGQDRPPLDDPDEHTDVPGP